MKVLYYDWDSLGQNDMIEGLKSSGIDVVLTTYRCSNYDFDSDFEIKLEKDIRSGNYDFVFSFNYFPVISKVCEKCQVKYVSWIFDSPHLTLYSETIKNCCNYVFHFDSYECENLKRIGAKNVFYLHLAANVERLDKIVCNESEKKLYSSDVSFVGRLYDKKNFYDKINYLPEYIKGYLEGIMNAQRLVYGYDFLEELLTESVLQEIKKYVKFDLGMTYCADDAFIFSNLFLGQKITSMERIEIFRMLSENFSVNLYSDADKALLPKVHNKGCIDNEKVMPKVFKQSKINLNISLRTIRTGIPLRVFDIIGAGGFLITNYQQDMYELFEEGKDFVIYESLDDLKEKVYYYLEHDDERNAVARSGYEKVKKYHTFKKRIEQMTKIVMNK